MSDPWEIRGDLVLSCNCDVFCPCVVSLGRSRPTQGVCHTWWGLHVEEGRCGDEPLDGLNAAVLMDVPGPLAEGKWTVGLYIDERANERAHRGLVEILSGRAGGPTAWFSIMISELLGVRSVPIHFESGERRWRLEIPKVLEGSVEPIESGDGEGVTRITNSRYWIAPDVVVCRGERSRLRDWGRNWDLSGRSAEYARVDWKGP